MSLARLAADRQSRGFKSKRDGLELDECGCEVFDDRSRDDLGRWEVFDVLEGVVLQPGDIEAGLVAGDELGHDKFDILGTSWGGGLAQRLAFQQPRRCRRLVLVSTATGSLMVPASPLVLGKMVTPRRHRDPDYARSIAAQLYGGRLRAEPDLARTLLHAHSRVGSRRGYLLQLLAGVGWTSLPGLPFVRQPTLILAGTDDPIIPLVNARIMARLLREARLTRTTTDISA
jgi:pimeloyl-ACP methyl ester carboxylesterase